LVHPLRLARLSATRLFLVVVSYDAYAHDVFVTGGFIAAAGGIAAFAVAVAMSVWRAREVKG
jgi:type IV secretory pathway TraG/TraD family ATPase VirD4